MNRWLAWSSALIIAVSSGAVFIVLLVWAQVFFTYGFPGLGLGLGLMTIAALVGLPYLIYATLALVNRKAGAAPASPAIPVRDGLEGKQEGAPRADSL